MTEQFRFSPRPNRAHEIDWRGWGAEPLDDARRTDKPVLLNLTAVWCHWCHDMDETTYSDPSVIQLIADEFIAIRVDADRRPHVRDRYIAGGWPTNALLTPDGNVLWAGTHVDADELRRVAVSALRAWRERRDELKTEMAQRSKAMESARGRRSSRRLVRREAGDDVLTTAQNTFDARNGGFDDAPKFPHAHAIEMLFVQGERADNPDWLAMAERTLDGMLAGELWDDADGGFFRYALAADWTEPQREKLLEINAGLLRAYALGSSRRDRGDWRETAERTVEWAERTLGRDDGLWSSSQIGDDEYYGLDAAAREERGAPAVDPLVYADANAHWIRSLVAAGELLGRDDWVRRGADALDTLLERMAAPEELLYHYEAPDADPALPGLLADQVEGARACLAVAEAAGRDELLEQADRLVGGMKRALWAENGGFLDHPRTGDAVGMLRFQDRPFEENAAAARLLVGLSRTTGERSCRAMAERILALLSPLAGRYGVAGAEFVLAVESFFEQRGR